MILKKCGGSYTPRVVEYIGEDKVLCFYLYMDLLECGAEGEGLGLWVCEEEDGLRAVMYRYYDALHLYSRGLCPREETLSLIRALDPKVITGRREIIDDLRSGLDGARYTCELSHIITADKLMDGKSSLEIRPASKADIPEIASLMMKEHIYNTVYTYDSLCASLTRRIDGGFGRLFLMRTAEGRLAATNGLSAESEEFAVINGLVTEPELRGMGLGRAITAST
ncbi:MAG: hypothetical protein IKD79_07130, partial [Oscillospiraceae bacterium]|nr:hypothetical protein [Oscillospiraceae bacterium]